MNHPKFACQEQLIPGETYREKFEFLKTIGFSGIEVWSNNLEKNYAELQEAHQAGVQVSSGCQAFEGGVINIQEEGRQFAIQATIEALQRLAPLGASGYVLPAGFALGSTVLPPYEPPRPAEEDTQALVDALQKILQATQGLGSCVFLEPINRYETHFLHTLEEAGQIAARLQHPSLMLLADFFHMSMEEARPDQSLLGAGRRLGHIHLADSNRKLPGQGHLDFVGHFAALQRAGFEGWMVIECDRPQDAGVELPAAGEFLHRCWQQALEASQKT